MSCILCYICMAFFVHKSQIFMNIYEDISIIVMMMRQDIVIVYFLILWYTINYLDIDWSQLK